MWRWTMRIFVVLGAFLFVAALSGATYQWLATRQEIAATPPPDISSTSEGTAASVVHRGRRACCHPRRGSRRYEGWLGFRRPRCCSIHACLFLRPGRYGLQRFRAVTADRAPHRERARRTPRRVAGLPDRSCWLGNPSRASTSVCSLPIVLSAPQVSCWSMPPTETMHMNVPGMARFIPLLSTIGILRLLGVSFGQSIESLAPPMQQSAQVPRFRAAGHQAAADEIIHIGETASAVRTHAASSPSLSSLSPVHEEPTENSRRLQQDEASLSERGCLITARQSGHVIPTDQPAMVVDAIRTVVEIARGHDVPLCATLAANGPGISPRP